jgi:hypothetical protein
MKMKIVDSSETVSSIYWTIWHHMPEDSCFHIFQSQELPAAIHAGHQNFAGIRGISHITIKNVTLSRFKTLGKMME